MKTLKLLALLGMLQVAANAAVLIEGSLGAMPTGNVNLNDYDAFAYYGRIGFDNYKDMPNPGFRTTDFDNVGQFSNLTLVGSGSINNTSSATFPYTISYSGAASPGITPTGTFDQNNVAGTTIAAFINKCVNGSALTFSTVLFAPEQTFQIYLLNYNSRTGLSATLAGSGDFSWSLNNQVLPTGGVDVTGAGNTFGILTLTVTGEIGDTLTFKTMADFSGVSNYSSGNVGIAAITAMAIPEPSAWACLVVGLGALVGLRRLRE